MAGAAAGTLTRRVAMLDPVRAATARQGADAARALRSAGDTPPVVTGLLEQVRIDHTVVDLVLVDERHRLPIGRPYITVAIDVQPLHRWPRPTSSDQDPKAPRRPRSFIESDSCYRPKHG